MNWYAEARSASDVESRGGLGCERRRAADPQAVAVGTGDVQRVAQAWYLHVRSGGRAGGTLTRSTKEQVGAGALGQGVGEPAE